MDVLVMTCRTVFLHARLDCRIYGIQMQRTYIRCANIYMATPRSLQPISFVAILQSPSLLFIYIYRVGELLVHCAPTRKHL